MAIRPIDMVKTQEASLLKNLESQKLQSSALQSEKNFHNMVQQQQHKPTKTPQSDNTEYRYDAKEKGNNQYQNLGNKKKNKDKEKKEDLKSKKASKTGGIDILI